MILPLKRVTIVSEAISLHGNEMCDISFLGWGVMNDHNKCRWPESDLTATKTTTET